MSLWDTVRKYANGASTLADWIGDGGHVVDAQIAQYRASVCLRCPKHTTSWQFTESVAGAIKQQLGLKKKLNLRVSGEKSLHTCSVCGCAMRLKVWLPLQTIKPEPAEESLFDSNCWLLHEKE